jgi:hypothetical protein
VAGEGANQIKYLKAVTKVSLSVAKITWNAGNQASGLFILNHNTDTRRPTRGGIGNVLRQCHQAYEQCLQSPTQ